MVISQATECAIRAMLYMATMPPDKIIGKREICKSQEITPAFLIKIMQPLISAGLVKSFRGVSGGFALAKPLDKISLWDIVNAEEGEILLNKCMEYEGYCKRDRACPVHMVWERAKDQMRETLSKATLDELARKL